MLFDRDGSSNHGGNSPVVLFARVSEQRAAIEREAEAMLMSYGGGSGGGTGSGALYWIVVVVAVLVVIAAIGWAVSRWRRRRIPSG